MEVPQTQSETRKMGSGEADASHGPTVNVYYTIFGCLAVLTFVTVFISRVHLPMVAAVIMALLIALSKATLVIAFFMHVKYDPKVIRLMCVVPIILTMIAMMALMPDIAMHGPQAAGSPEVGAQLLSEYAAEAGGAAPRIEHSEAGSAEGEAAGEHENTTEQAGATEEHAATTEPQNPGTENNAASK